MEVIVVYSGIVFGVLAVFFLNLVLNLIVFHRLRPSKGTRNPAKREAGAVVSILVPARNEADHIEECVRSLIGQYYERLEVLVLDDQSRDETAEIVQHVIDQMPEEQQGRLRLLPGEPLPQGWVGKNFACYQLAQQARGNYLLFTDADSVHAPETVELVIDCMDRLEVQFLTAQPHYALHSFGERLALPLLYFKVFTLLPLLMVQRSSIPIFAVANGPLLCFRREAYETVGGHAAVKGAILEDNSLARCIKARGYRMAYVDAVALVSCYMYDSCKELWEGLSRTFFSFYDYSLLAAAAIIFLDLALFVIPPLLALIAVLLALPRLILVFAGGAYVLAVLMRTLLAIRIVRTQKMSMVMLCLLHPVAMVLECLILINSMRWYYRKAGTVWKGRYYTQ